MNRLTIARAVNAHEKLLEVAKALLYDLKEAHAEELEHDHYGDSELPGGDLCLYCKDIRLAEDAIRKTEEETK